MRCICIIALVPKKFVLISIILAGSYIEHVSTCVRAHAQERKREYYCQFSNDG